MKKISQETIDGILNALANTELPAKLFVAITNTLQKLEAVEAVNADTPETK